MEKSSNHTISFFTCVCTRGNKLLYTVNLTILNYETNGT